MKNDIKVLSFFTGAGFLDIGFLQEGFDIIWHNEYYKPFINAFQTGLESLGYSGHSSKIQNSDSIVNIGPNQIIEEAFGKELPSMFGIIGGPPCPDFSTGGKNKGHSGDHGKLSEVYVNRIIELNPTFFIFENVPGLIRTSKHRIFLVKLLEKLSSKYFLDINILNALDFGVPQDRERVFIVGFNKKWTKLTLKQFNYNKFTKSTDNLFQIKDLPIRRFLELHDHWFPWPVNAEFCNAKKRFLWPKEVVPKGQIPAKPIGCPEALMSGTYLCNDNRFSLKNSKDVFNVKSKKIPLILEGDVAKKSYKKLHRYKYSPAVAYGNNEVHLHPILPRRLSVREAMMLQSVPNEYFLPEDMTLSDKYKTIGNGVPVKLAAAIANAINNFINRTIYETF